MHEDPSRTNPIGLTRYASEFYEAALAVHESTVKGDNEIASAPAMFLIGQSIELALKAYLVHRGVGLRDLRVKYSHDLLHCHKKARELGFSAHFSPSAEGLVALHLLDNLYATKRLQYIVTGVVRVPAFSVLKALAHGILLAAGNQAGYPAGRLPT